MRAHGSWFLKVSIVAVFFVAAGPPLFPVYGSEALSPAARRGHDLVRSHCSHCHAVEKAGASPLKVAPPFRTLHLRYPVENLEEALAEGIATGHPFMPEFRFGPDQVGDVIAYLKSLER